MSLYDLLELEDLSVDAQYHELLFHATFQYSLGLLQNFSNRHIAQTFSLYYHSSQCPCICVELPNQLYPFMLTSMPDLFVY